MCKFRDDNLLFLKRNTEEERKIFHMLAHSTYAHIKQGWAQSRLGNQNSIWTLMQVAGTQEYEPPHATLQGVHEQEVESEAKSGFELGHPDIDTEISSNILLTAPYAYPKH